MTPSLVLSLPGNDTFAHEMADRLGAESAPVEVHRFPDQEARVRIPVDVQGRRVAVVCTLDRPDPKYLPLAFTLGTLRELGAARIVLAAPYLCYMRQDRRFQEGEAVSARLFAGRLRGLVDGLVTVDPHLHRIGALEPLFDVPVRVVHAAPLLGEAVRTRVSAPLFVGPDEESEQWVAAVASASGAPATVLRKTRRGDRDVEVTVPDLARWLGRTPVLVDDIVSTGRTMIAATRHLRAAGATAPVVAVVHALFAPRAAEELAAAGVGSVLSCNTVEHPTNAVDVAPPVAAAVAALLE